MSHYFEDLGPPRRGDNRKVCLATTVYAAPDAAYTFSMARSRQALSEAGIDSAYLLLQGNCHVDDARNRLVQEFLLSDCTELVFLDSDVSWRPEALIRLCRHPKQVVGGVYPYRREGTRDSMPYRGLAPTLREPSGLIEVEALPAGFLKIARSVLERLEACAERFWHREDRRRQIPIIFERTLSDGKRWGGDITFCKKWRALGGKIWADPDLMLGHTGSNIHRGSLASHARRMNGVTLSHVCDKIAGGGWTLDDLTEATRYVGNPYGALEDTLACAVRLARDAEQPILELGSGLSTVLMAAATEQMVYCIEHHALHVAKLRQLSAEAGVTNIGICIAGIKDGWYDPADFGGLPERFSFALVDGPPRGVGDRELFWNHFGGQVDAVIIDDADDEQYRDLVVQRARELNMRSVFLEPRTMLLRAA